MGLGVGDEVGVLSKPMAQVGEVVEDRVGAVLAGRDRDAVVALL